MEFTKLHALGNDFLVIYPGKPMEDHILGDLARRICDRHTGVGADGLLILNLKDKEKGEVLFRIFNADGSESNISGNGLRCAAAFLYYHKIIDRPDTIFQTPAGWRTCDLIENKSPFFEIRIGMGQPRFSSKEIPFDDGQTYDRILDYPMSINQKVHQVTCVSMGNPHCTIFVDRFPARIEWHQTGREIESHPFFPKRTNVEFIRVINREEIEVLFWERGVGETLSSGSGSCAAAVSSITKGLTDDKVKVWTSMGPFVVELKNGMVFQTGPAETVFVGNYPAP